MEYTFIDPPRKLEAALLELVTSPSVPIAFAGFEFGRSTQVRSVLRNSLHFGLVRVLSGSWPHEVALVSACGVPVHCFTEHGSCVDLAPIAVVSTLFELDRASFLQLSLLHSTKFTELPHRSIYLGGTATLL